MRITFFKSTYIKAYKLVKTQFSFRHMAKTAMVEGQSTDTGIQMSNEAITNIRTVASLSM